MNYNLQSIDKPSSTFATRFTLPLWQYVVAPRKPEDAPYITELDFGEFPLNTIFDSVQLVAGDVLEIFELTKRVLFTGISLEVLESAETTLTPVTNSRIPFDAIDCSIKSRRVLAVNGGEFNYATEIDTHSVLVDDPDFLGLRIDAGVSELANLKIKIELSVSDEYSWAATPNYARI